MILTSHHIVFIYLLFGFILLICGFVKFHQTKYNSFDRLTNSLLLFLLGGVFFNAAFKIYYEYENLFRESTLLNCLFLVALIVFQTIKAEKEEEKTNKE